MGYNRYIEYRDKPKAPSQGGLDSKLELISLVEECNISGAQIARHPPRKGR